MIATPTSVRFTSAAIATSVKTYLDEHSLDDMEQFLYWVKGFRADEEIGFSNDPRYDPIAYYLRMVWLAPRPFVNSGYWMTDEEYPWYSINTETPEWVSRLIYMFDVFGKSTVLTANDVLLMMRACRLVDEMLTPLI